MAITPQRFDISKFNLDVKLEAISNLDETRRDFVGKKTFSSSMFKEGKGFGITRISIVTNPSLQPIVEITFKDLYGNLAFGSQFETNKIVEKGEAVDYSVLFEWPPPKFELTIKGYLGKSIKWLLSLKKTTTINMPDDGSYEIKTVFVPNVFGFFADIPFSYMYAVPSLKQKNGLFSTTDQINSVIDITEVGPRVENRISKAINVFDKPIGDINSLLNDAVSFLNEDTETKLKNGIPAKTQNQIAFTNNVKFDLTFNGKELNNGVDLRTIKAYLNAFSNTAHTLANNIILVSTTKKVDLIKGPFPSKMEVKLAKDLLNFRLKENEERKKALIYSVGKEEIGSLTIGRVFEQIGSDSGFLLGKILQAGLKGGRGRSSETLDKKYYPLNQDGIDLIPLEQTYEMNFVDEFIKALASGLVKKELEDNSNQLNGDSGINFVENKKIINPLVSVEYLSTNPYDLNMNSKDFFSNVLIRSGIASYITRSATPNKPGELGTGDNNIENIKKLAELEYKNIPSDFFITIQNNQIFNDELKNYCQYILNFFDSEGGVRVNLSNGGERIVKYDEIDGVFSETFLRDSISHTGSTNSLYTFSKFLSQFNSVGLSGIDKDSLKTKSLFHNGIEYVNPTKKNNDDTEIYYVAFHENNTIDAVSNVSNNQNVPTDNISNFSNVSETVGNALGGVAGFIAGITSLVTTDDNISTGFIKIKTSNEQFFVDKIIPAISENRVLDYTKLVNRSQNYLYTDITVGSNGIYVSPYTKGPGNTDDYTSEGLVWGLFENNDIRSRNQKVFLYHICNKILSSLKNKQNSTEFNSKVDEKIKLLKENNIRTTLYRQFRNIFFYWKSLVNTGDGIQINYDELPSEFSKKYSKTIGSDSKDYIDQFCFKFDWPLNYLSAPTNYNIANSIINIDPIKDGIKQGETTVLNVLTNLCLKNNFLFLAIPGNGHYEDVNEIFTAYSTSVEPKVGNIFHVLWSPTPEERMSTNNSNYGSFVDFSKISVNSEKFFQLDFGSVDNTVVKNIRVSTEDNKATGESILYLNELSNRQNTNKKPQFDCSLIPMMQGRSYKATCEVIGNAQIAPLQFFGVSKLPLFNGLYQILKVEHNISNNNMTTSFEGIKLMYNNNKFSGIPPITLDELKNTAANINESNQNQLEGNRIPKNKLRQDTEHDAKDVYKQYRNSIGKIKNQSIPKEIKALLDTISWTEGTISREANGYDILVGYTSNNSRKIESWNENYPKGHQDHNWYYPRADSTAAGRYQFLGNTWKEVSQTYLNESNANFNKENQDYLAYKRLKWRLSNKGISEQYILDTLSDKEKFVKVSNALAPEWASFPFIDNNGMQRSYYGGQNARDFEDVYTFFTLSYADEPN